eukprot:SAG31_NODE_20973_length_560_cov_1.403471_1_plen_43_part_10
MLPRAQPHDELTASPQTSKFKLNLPFGGCVMNKWMIVGVSTYF